MPDQLILSASDAATILGRLAAIGTKESQLVYWRITSLWLGPQRTHVTYRPGEEERATLRRITLPSTVVQSHRYVARYQCVVRPDVEVTLRTRSTPAKHRTFRTAGGVARFTLIEVTDVTTNRTTKENTMARKTTSTKAKSTKSKAAEEDELEAELAGLEELDELEEEAEPDEVDEDEETDEEEDEDSEEVNLSAMTVAELKAYAKENGVKGIDKKNKAQLIALIEENMGEVEDEESDDEDEEEPELEEEEPEEEEEDEEEEDDSIDLDPLSRSELKALIKEHELGVKVFKSTSDDDLRSAIAEALGQGGEDEEEEDEEPAKPAAKGGSKGKAPAKGTRKAPTPPNRELPKGKLGAEAVAQAAGTDARTVRMFLRSERGQAFPKDEALNRYAFTSKQVADIAKLMANKPKRAVTGAAKAAQDRKIAGATKPKSKGTRKK